MPSPADTASAPLTAEAIRLEESRQRLKHWKRWGPYVSERAWGTVREDYSADGSAWEYFTHEQARARAYRWNEDGLAAICDRHQRICFALALWNGRDRILKERLFGLTNREGNHGEDVKEYYFYLDSTPTHSYMRFLYKYPQQEFPYRELLDENRRRGKQDGEFELLDTGVFADNRYFDVEVEYAKEDPEDILVAVHVTNRGSGSARLDLLPTAWFRNTWSWAPETDRPAAKVAEAAYPCIALSEPLYGRRWLHCDASPELLFTGNDTNTRDLFGDRNGPRHSKDAFHRYVVGGDRDAINPYRYGTKAAARYSLEVAGGETVTVRLRLNDRRPDARSPFGPGFDAAIAQRRREADEFYASVLPASLSKDGARVARQAFAGLLWSKQFYHYVVSDWLRGDPGLPPPPVQRRRGRNFQWTHLYNADVLSMPDKWEYPWYAAWDLAFHVLPLALVDSDFAKEQLVLMLREWYMHPNGQLPAYEWGLHHVNPPVHAWAAMRVYKIDQKRHGVADRAFLERVFQKLLLNFTWWVNRKDAEGKNVFQGGFLGFDNIGVFDRSAPLPTGGHLEQSDGTSWMAMYSLNMLAIATELARENPAYEDVASKFWEHFLYIAHAMSGGRVQGGKGQDLWDEEDGFFYDVLQTSDGHRVPLRVRSLVGLIPLLAVQTLEPDDLDRMDGFRRRLEWFVQYRPDLTRNVASMRVAGRRDRRLMAILDAERLHRVLQVMLDEREFLSAHGIRALSAVHSTQPYSLHVNGTEYRVSYEPGESSTALFGGNSNWRGPVWFPANFLLIEAIQKFHHYYGDAFKIECPTGSGTMMTLAEVATDLSLRLSKIFLRNSQGRRPVYSGVETFQTDPHWNDLILFYEYFHGDTGAGLGASHQTGWTGLVAKLLQQSGD